jgi:hypothetical protein
MKKAALLFLLLCVSFGCWHFFFRSKEPLLAKGHYARIPVVFVGNNPLIEVEIEGKKYPLKLDLGAACQFAFFKEALEAITEKKFIEFLITTDIKGNQYKVGSYSVPLVKTKNLKCKNAVILEESIDFVTKGAMLWPLDGKQNSQIPFIGRIGRECFTSNNLVLDFPNSMLFVTSSLEELKVDHWPMRELFETSFELGCWGIVLSFETDIGVKKLVLDTGANTSILKSSSKPTAEREILTTTKFATGGHDFGPFNLSLFEMGSSIDADGLLGLDFIKKHAIYLDFKNSKAFIGPSSEICGAIVFQ